MATPTALSKANTTFSLALLQKLGDNDNSANLFFSPFSISSALAMVMMGARGNTAAQMTEVLRFPGLEKPQNAGVAPRLMDKQVDEQMGGQWQAQMNRHRQMQTDLQTQMDKHRQMQTDMQMQMDKQKQKQMEMQMQMDKQRPMDREMQMMMDRQMQMDMQMMMDRQRQLQMEMQVLLDMQRQMQMQMQVDREMQVDQPMLTEKPPQVESLVLKPMQRSMPMQQRTEFTLPKELRCMKTQVCQDNVHSSFAELLTELNKADAPYALSVANRLYGEQSYQFVDNYLESTRKHYKAELEAVDFQSSAEAARVNINTWVENKTQGKIKDLLASGVVDHMTRLVLVNAIYFKGNWNKKFEENRTRDSPFRVNKNEAKTVKMMYQKSKFPLTWIPEATCQILEMPYKGEELSMLIFLPDVKEDGTASLEELEKMLTYENFSEWTRPDMMDEVEVQVGLPRFKLEEKYDMKNVLVSMGMEDAFDMSKCDFSGMSPGNDLVLSKVFHKAFVEVNEEGTEAAAATGMVMMMRCLPRIVTFIADHPFLFFIRHNPSKSILFAGRYCCPE